MNSKRDLNCLLMPTGPYQVGTVSFDLIDGNQSPKRLIPIQIYFPLGVGKHIPHEKIIETRAPEHFPPLKCMGFSKPAKLSEIADGEHLLILFNHGRYVPMTDYAIINEDLASHGSIIVSIQHELNTDPKEPRLWKGRSLNRHARIIDNLLYVFDWIKQEKAKTFSDRIAIGKTALIGHSVGGNALFLLAERISEAFRPECSTLLPREQGETAKECLVFLDGEFDFPRSHRFPILLCLSEERKSYQEAYGTLGELRKSGHSFIYYQGARHISFMDHCFLLETLPGNSQEPYFYGTQEDISNFYQLLRKDIRDFLKSELLFE